MVGFFHCHVTVVFPSQQMPNRWISCLGLFHRLLSPTLWFTISCRQLVAKQKTSTSSESILNRQLMTCFLHAIFLGVGQAKVVHRIQALFPRSGGFCREEAWFFVCFLGFGLNQGQHQVCIDLPPGRVVGGGLPFVTEGRHVCVSLEDSSGMVIQPYIYIYIDRYIFSQHVATTSQLHIWSSVFPTTKDT